MSSGGTTQLPELSNLDLIKFIIKSKSIQFDAQALKAYR